MSGAHFRPVPVVWRLSDGPGEHQAVEVSQSWPDWALQEPADAVGEFIGAWMEAEWLDQALPSQFVHGVAVEILSPASIAGRYDLDIEISVSVSALARLSGRHPSTQVTTEARP